MICPWATTAIVRTFFKSLFVVQPYAGVFCSHYNAYEVYTIPTSYLFYKQNDLIDHHILSFSKSFSPPLSHKLFVSLKYHVFV